MKKEQPFLGKNGTLLFLIVISALPLLTTNLYLPALPQMADVFKASQSTVNLTLSVYFVIYSFGLLFWGPLSEKYGRKPILLTGIGVYVLGCFLCAVAESIEFLISVRVLQAFGSSAVSVVATAVLKDLYDGREREKIMAVIMSLITIAPMVASVLGAFLLNVFSWRMMFVVLAIFGGLSIIFACCYHETLETRYSGSVVRSWGRLFVVLKNPAFVSLLGIFSIVPMVLMAFLGVSSYIYIDHFGLTAEQFSYAFAFNALCAAFGPGVYMKLSSHFSIQTIIMSCFGLLALCGILTFTLGHVSPWLFAFLAGPATLAVIIMRVPGLNIMLEQQDEDTGSAVAVIQFLGMLCGSFGMMFASIQTKSLIKNLGTIQFTVGLVGIVLWLIVRNRSNISGKVAQVTH